MRFALPYGRVDKLGTPCACQLLPQDLEQLLRRLPPPMGLGPRATEGDVMRFVFRWGRGGDVRG